MFVLLKCSSIDLPVTGRWMGHFSGETFFNVEKLSCRQTIKRFVVTNGKYFACWRLHHLFSFSVACFAHYAAGSKSKVLWRTAHDGKAENWAGGSRAWGSCCEFHVWEGVGELVNSWTAQTSMKRGLIGDLVLPLNTFQHAVVLLGRKRVQAEVRFAGGECSCGNVWGEYKVCICP